MKSSTKKTNKKPSKTQKYDSGARNAKIVRADQYKEFVHVSYKFKNEKQAKEVYEQFLKEGEPVDFCLDLEDNPV